MANETRTKFQPKATKCIFLGYVSTSTYRLWDLSKNKLVVGRNVTFDEKSILNRLKATKDSEAVIHFDSDNQSITSAAALDETLDEFEEALSDNGVNLDGTGDCKENVHSANW